MHAVSGSWEMEVDEEPAVAAEECEPRTASAPRARPTPRPRRAPPPPMASVAPSEWEAGGLRRSGRARKTNVTLLTARIERDAAAPLRARAGASLNPPRLVHPPTKRSVARSAPRHPDEVLRWAVKEIGALTGASVALGADSSAEPPEFRRSADESTLRESSSRMRELVEAGVWNSLCAVCGQYNRKADMASSGACSGGCHASCG